MLTAGNELVHSDINAIIAGPNPDGKFDASTYPLENAGKRNPALPNRLEAFREFTVIFHDEIFALQAFPQFYDNPDLSHALAIVKDGFAVNYGTGGIGSEIIANRLGVGPMANCVECKYEEFFLTSPAVGDNLGAHPPGTVIDHKGVLDTFQHIAELGGDGLVVLIREYLRGDRFIKKAYRL